MATGQLGSVFRQIGRLFGPGTVSGLTEAQLLARFVERRDEAAFEALVSRFGPMVLGVCRQVLADHHAADDAFQATFLVLVKRARSIRERELLGNWLYGVALKVAKRARADQAKRRAREQEGQPVAAEPIGNGRALDDIELGPILHEELARLPEKYRAPMVLCYLDGQTCEEAAGRLGWPVGTVKGRLSRAKDMLRGRLARRGVTASAAILAATLTKAAEASVPQFLLDQTVRAAMGFAAGGSLAAAGLGSAAAVALAEGVHTTMILTKWKAIAIAATLFGTLAGSAAVMARQGSGGAAQDKAAQNAKVEKELPNPAVPGEVALGGARPTKGPAKAPVGAASSSPWDGLLAATVLPEERASVAQLLKERVGVAKRSLDSMGEPIENSTNPMDRIWQAARDYTDARVQAAGDDRAEAIKANEEHVRWLQGVYNGEKASYESGEGGRLSKVAQAELKLLDAKIALAQARSGQDKPAAAVKGRKLKDQAAGEQEIGGFRGVGATVAAQVNANGGEPAASDDPAHDTRILDVLEKPISMPFPIDTPLDDVIKYIKTATTGPDFELGLPIYVDPQGLQTAEKTMTSPIALNLEGIKLKTSLRLVLKQLGMGYYVKHGLLIISDPSSLDFRDATEPGWRTQEAQEEARANAGARVREVGRVGGFAPEGGGGIPPGGGGGFGGGAGGGGKAPKPEAKPAPKGGGMNPK